MNRTSHTAVAAVILVMSSLLPAAAAPLTPVILFPGWGTTRLEVRVHNQSVAPDCPGSGTFEYNDPRAGHRVQPGVPEQAFDARVPLRPPEAPGDRAGAARL